MGFISYAVIRGVGERGVYRDNPDQCTGWRFHNQQGCQAMLLICGIDVAVPTFGEEVVVHSFYSFENSVVHISPRLHSLCMITRQRVRQCKYLLGRGTAVAADAWQKFAPIVVLSGKHLVCPANLESNGKAAESERTWRIHTEAACLSLAHSLKTRRA